jgi:aspartate racemase
MTKHIGIVACSAEGAALCYKTICIEGANLLGEHAHPEVSLHTHSLADYMKCIYRDDWAGVGELMLSSAQKLAKAGADFVICPDNTIHQALSLIEERSPIPWLHIADCVASRAGERGYRRLGLLGTQWLVESGVYPARLASADIECVRPQKKERQEINRIIMNELVCGVLRDESTSMLQRVIDEFKRGGCDAVILGCTELPLVLSDSNSPLPTLDSTRLLARSALQRACLTTSQVLLRSLRAEDEPFLWRMLTYAASMGGSEESVEAAKKDPMLYGYAKEYGREGDTGVVAEIDGVCVGAAWARLGEPHPTKRWTKDTPELAIATMPGYRGQRIGEKLMHSLIQQLKGRFPALVLSVREENPAVRLYERLGFVTEEIITNRVGGRSLAMRLDLSR